MLIDWTEIIVALIGFAGATYGVYYRNKSNQVKAELEEIKAEIKTDVSLSLQDINKLDNAITGLFEKTKVERFIVFKGENGRISPLTFTSAILERHKQNMYFMLSIGATEKYVRVRFDNDYLDMLKDLEYKKGGVYLDVKEMRKSDLKGFYEDEQIHHSCVWFQNRYPLDEDKHIVLYYSFATHSEFEYTEKEKQLIRLAANKIAALNFNVSAVK